MQFCVYANTHPKSKKAVPYLLDIQSDLHENLSTRVVVPLMPVSLIKDPIIHLNPRFMIEGKEVVMSTPELAGVDKKLMGKKIGTLESQRNEIIGALDFLLTGF